jgi:hypothetical protein
MNQFLGRAVFHLFSQKANECLDGVFRHFPPMAP